MLGFDPLKTVLIVIVWTALTGCAYQAAPQLTGPDTHVIVRASPDRQAPTAIGIFEFKGPREYEPLCQGLTRFAHRKLHQQGFAPEVVWMEKPAWDEHRAMEAALDQHIEWVLWGRIEEYAYGGTLGASKVTICLKLLDVATGEPVWDLIGTMTGQGRDSADYVLFRRENPGAPMPDDIAFVVLDRLIETILQNGAMGPVAPPR